MWKAPIPAGRPHKEGELSTLRGLRRRRSSNQIVEEKLQLSVGGGLCVEIILDEVHAMSLVGIAHGEMNLIWGLFSDEKKVGAEASGTMLLRRKSFCAIE